MASVQQPQQPTNLDILIALDQATATTGWAIYINGYLQKYGHYHPDGDYLTRIVALRKWVLNLIETCRTDNNKLYIAIEEIQLQDDTTDKVPNVSTFKKLAHVQGVLLELLVEMNVPYEVVPSVSWKSAVGVKSRKREQQKKEAQEHVFRCYGIKVSQDEADAICIGEYVLKGDVPKEDSFNWS